MTKRILFLLSFITCILMGATAQKNGHELTVTVMERGSKEPVVMATLKLLPAEVMAVTDMNGVAIMRNVPKGEYMLQISYVGFETINARVKVDGDRKMSYVMHPTSLSLKEVKVTARQRESGASTASVIGRQAIDHLQASSLADVMQLIPGQLMGNNNLISPTNLQLRSIAPNNATAAFGASIVIDGMPVSNNGSISAGGFTPTAFSGTDLRQVAADNIDEVEVIRGIPSAEYGDLTSGLVVVHSKVGVTPLQVKAKINPALQNFSAGKGMNLGKWGIVNFNADYAKAWGDPREKSRSYDRYTIHVGYGKDITRRWHTDTKLRFVHTKDWNGEDPDAVQTGNETKNKNLTLGITHNGRIQLDMPLARTLKYTAGLNYTQTDNRTTAFVGSSRRNDIVTAMETGYNNVNWIQDSYQATGYTESRPGNVFLKLTDDFFWRKGKTVQRFKIGADYRYDWNNAKGFYNEDDSHPYKTNENSRPRPFYDIPGLHQLSFFAEDNFLYNINKVNKLRVNFGLRFSSMQPFGDVATTALSPRLNVAFSVTEWLDLRAGIGMNSKAPGLNHLYPDKKYIDKVAAQEISQSDPVTSIVNYHTVVYDVEYSRQLKNATTTKIEAGIDIKLPGNRKLSLLAYHDKTPNGFGNETEYLAYYHNTYSNGSGYTIKPGQPTTISNYDNYASHYLYYMTTGKVGNTNTTVNKGVEIDFDLGEVKPLRTSIYLSGAWNESKSWDTDLNTSNPKQLPSTGAPTDYTPIKFIYPSGEDFTRYRRFVTTLRLVTHIPELRMVASLTGQAIWHDSNWTYTSNKVPTGWLHTIDNGGVLTVVQENLSTDMLTGYIGYNDGQYHATNTDGTQPYISIADNNRTYTDTEPTKQSITWNTQFRLTKELGRVGSLSFYVSNALFYEPYMSTNKSSTPTQRNTGTFSFGAELSLNL